MNENREEAFNLTNRRILFALRSALVKWQGQNLDYKDLKNKRGRGSRSKCRLIFQDIKRDVKAKDETTTGKEHGNNLEVQMPVGHLHK